jgi:hypothetical protein
MNEFFKTKWTKSASTATTFIDLFQQEMTLTVGWGLLAPFNTPYCTFYCSYCFYYFIILNCLQYVHKNVNNKTEYKAPEYSEVSYSLMMVKYDWNASDKHNQGFYVIYRVNKEYFSDQCCQLPPLDILGVSHVGYKNNNTTLYCVLFTNNRVGS